MKYKTSEFARIRCVDCNEIVATLMPGQLFDDIPECKCRKVIDTNYEAMNIEDIRAILKTKNIPFSPQALKPTLIKKLKEA